MRTLIFPKNSDIRMLLSERKNEFSRIQIRVSEIVNSIKKEGDKALQKWINEFEKFPVSVKDLRVRDDEFNDVDVPEDFERSLKNLIDRVKDFHVIQVERNKFTINENGSFLGFKIQPIESVGIYVPGGKAPYFSSLVMCAVPAKVAGVERIVVVTPPDPTGKISPFILKTCLELGIDEVYKVGGAQAVAVLAYGTENIKRVDKIVGPGNIYVTLAKKLVYGDCGIDSVAGPSEVLVIADENAKAEYVAADLLSQAEHDENAMSVLVTTSKELLEKVIFEVTEQLEELPFENREVARVSIENHGIAILVEDLNRTIEISNLIAPEHLEIITKEPFEVVKGIKNAGSIFIGDLSSEPVGDYGIGPNHVLPTSGSARFSSGLSVSDFVKKVFLTSLSEKDLLAVGKEFVKLARFEGLEAHAMAVERRLRGYEK